MARICREYGMTYGEVLKLPLRTFWSFNRQVDRLRAEEDQRSLRVASSAQSAEGAKALTEQLKEELASPVVIERSFDEEGWQRLKQKIESGA